MTTSRESQLGARLRVQAERLIAAYVAPELARGSIFNELIFLFDGPAQREAHRLASEALTGTSLSLGCLRRLATHELSPLSPLAVMAGDELQQNALFADVTASIASRKMTSPRPPLLALAGAAFGAGPSS